MKRFKLNIFFVLLPMLMTFSSLSQLNLSIQVSEARNTKWDLRYVDSSGNIYERGYYAGVPMKIVFRKIEFNKKGNVVIVEGLTTAFYNKNDTLGLCCVKYFIAQPIHGYLVNIRKLGETNSNQIGDNSKPDGYFSFKFILSRKDRLYFIGSNGTGLEEYPLGNVCYELSSPIEIQE